MYNEDKIIEMPAVALRALTVVPGMILHFDLSRSKSILAIEQALKEQSKIFLVTQKNPETEEPALEDLYTVGTISIVKQITKLPEGIVRVLVEGIEKAGIVSQIKNPEYLKLVIQTMEYEDVESEEEKAMVRSIKEQLGIYSSVHPQIGRALLQHLDEYQQLEPLLEKIMNHIPFPYVERQKLLEATTKMDSFLCMMELLHSENEIGKIRMQLSAKVRERVEKNQKEYVLREQLQYIKEELGEEEQEEEYSKQLKELDASPEVKAKIQKELKRLEAISTNSPEYGIQQNYIETLLAMPWNKMSKDNKNIGKAEKILDGDHYGLDKVKEKVLEFLAVRTLTKKGESPILCLVGPPGTGKTSIARSIANALDKKYVRVCLGGVRDEAEIRGHRRTYMGAMPGRIVTGLKQAGVSNPVMLLDEIDKTGKDQRGDTASALLEVLDGEQNVAFRDHYLEIPVDLSEVFFIATANTTETIPKPLLDRMEVVEVNSYTEIEKFHIAKKYLYPKQLKANGLDSGQLKITDAAIRKIISGYTKEAGVRNLERKIASVCRKSALQILKEKREKVSVDGKNLHEFLGKEIYHREEIDAKNLVGVVRGLAWTSVGGVTLEVEVNTMPGKGNVELTGQLGDVMKESAKAAFSYVRSNGDRWGIPSEQFEKNDIHIHIPEGATPKDGPSAGITMTTAIVSAFTHIPVKREIAMTGEVTLRGRVLPIGGLKEKLLAAIFAGCTEAIVPKQNQSDVAELPKEIIEKLDIHFVSEMKEVLELALEEKKIW